jgi:outer membrane protein assembly factor BamD
MVNKTRIAALLLLPVILLPVAGCAGNKKVKGDTAYVARDVNTLYSQAKQRLDRGRKEKRRSSAKLSASIPIRSGLAGRSVRRRSYYMAQKYRMRSAPPSTS